MKPRRCPICPKPAQKEWLPFCSDRCRDIDLANWAVGTYAVPVVESDEDGVDDEEE